MNGFAIILLFAAWFDTFEMVDQDSCIDQYFSYQEKNIDKLYFEYKSQLLDDLADRLLESKKISSSQKDSLKSIRFLFEMDRSTSSIVLKKNHEISLPNEYIGIVSSMQNMLSGFSELWSFITLSKDTLLPYGPNNILATGESIEFDSECIIKSIKTEMGTIYPAFTETDEGLVVTKIDYYDQNNSIKSIIEYILVDSVYYPKKLHIMTQVDTEVFTLSFSISNYRTKW